jgi:hypothetical protein
MVAMDIIYKYIEIYKEEISQKVIETLFPLMVKSLKYYGVYQIISNYIDLMVNIFGFLLALLVIKFATFTSTTENARAPLFIIAICMFLIEQFIYGTYIFLTIQMYTTICLIKLIRMLLFIIALYIYVNCHMKSKRSLYNNNNLINTIQQPQIIYNVVVNNNNYIDNKIPQRVIDLSGELTEDEEFLKEKNVPQVTKTKRKYVRKQKKN